MTLRLLILGLLLNSCCPAPTETERQAEPELDAAQHFVYLYARLHESQPRETAEAQYLSNLNRALANYASTITLEEITGTEGDVEFIGVDFKIAAPESETEALESLLMDTFRLSGAPYATQIFVVSP